MSSAENHEGAYQKKLQALRDADIITVNAEGTVTKRKKGDLNDFAGDSDSDLGDSKAKDNYADTDTNGDTTDGFKDPKDKDAKDKK